MTDLSIREITVENWRDALALSVLPEQQRFVAGSAPIAALVLAKAYVRPGGLTWVPYAFYIGDEMIGMAALAYRPSSADDYWLFHFFIDRAYQGRGHGRRALVALLDLVRDTFPACRAVKLTVQPENEPAARLYRSEGFVATGDLVDGEAVYRLELQP